MGQVPGVVGPWGGPRFVADVVAQRGVDPGDAGGGIRQRCRNTVEPLLPVERPAQAARLAAARRTAFEHRVPVSPVISNPDGVSSAGQPPATSIDAGAPVWSLAWTSRGSGVPRVAWSVPIHTSGNRAVTTAETLTKRPSTAAATSRVWAL